MDEDTKFRRALKSPFVMMGLCIMAGIAVYHNVIDSTTVTSLPISVASITSVATPTHATAASSPQGHSEIASQWIDNPKRDPFAPISSIKWSRPPSNSSTASASPKPQAHTRSSTNLQLKAVAIEAQRRSAVINRQVVYEGETIEGYQVLSIQLQGVWVQGHGKKELLIFATNTSS